MVKIYGLFERFGFCIGDDLEKLFFGEYTREQAAKILSDPEFIKIYNKNHARTLKKLVFEVE
jgi:hypothetical protein